MSGAHSTPPPRIYLDHNARWPLSMDAQRAMTQAMEAGGNPSSPHAEGQAARVLLERAREQVAEFLGASPAEVIFASGATEALHLAVMGALRARPALATVLSTTAEHHAVGHQLELLRSTAQVRVALVDVDAGGLVQEEAWLQHARAEVPPTVATLLWVNNETGVTQDVERLCRPLMERGTFVILDAVQAAGRLRWSARDLPAHAVVISAAKLGGPPGVGALWLRKGHGSAWQPPLRGGAQERGRRPGTENLLGAVGMGAACAHFPWPDMHNLMTLRTQLEQGLQAQPVGAVIHAHESPRVATTVFASFPGVDAQTLIMLLDQEGVAVGSGAACESGAVQKSHVLRAMDVPEPVLRGAVRFSLGPTSNASQLDAVLRKLAQVLPNARLR